MESIYIYFFLTFEYWPGFSGVCCFASHICKSIHMLSLEHEIGIILRLNLIHPEMFGGIKLVSIFFCHRLRFKFVEYVCCYDLNLLCIKNSVTNSIAFVYFLKA